MYKVVVMNALNLNERMIEDAMKRAIASDNPTLKYVIEDMQILAPTRGIYEFVFKIREEVIEEVKEVNEDGKEKEGRKKKTEKIEE